MSDEKEAETEYIEEELVVYADFGELLDEELLDEKDLNVQLIGIESETPILQLGGHVFRGTWDEPMGTAVIFEVSDEPMPGDPLFDSTPDFTLKYDCKASKKLNMGRIFIEKKSDVTDAKTMKPERNIPTCKTLDEAFEKLVNDANEMNISDA